MAGRAGASITLVSDDGARSRRLADLLSRRFHVHTADLAEFLGDGSNSLTYVVDADLSNRETISQIRERVTRALPGRDKYFVINDESRTDLVQANALGARGVLRKSCIERDAAMFINGLNQQLADALWHDQPAAAQLALTGLDRLYDNLFTAVAANGPLPKAQIANCCDYLIASLKEQTPHQWIEAVRQHHSHSYRHWMTVSGLAVCFALRLGMRRADVERLALAALLHDIGKMHLPLGLLDKPDVPTQEEREAIMEHAAIGAKILEADKQFGTEVVSVARHHHELLDGSGYPNGLKGDEIPDTVRIITVIDRFASLIGEEADSAAMPGDMACAIMEAMPGQLDADIVRAFRPVALEAGGTEREPASVAAE